MGPECRRAGVTVCTLFRWLSSLEYARDCELLEGWPCLMFVRPVPDALDGISLAFIIIWWADGRKMNKLSSCWINNEYPTNLAPSFLRRITVNAAVEMKHRRRAKPGEAKAARPAVAATGHQPRRRGLPSAQPRGCFPVIAVSAPVFVGTHTQQKQENMLGKVVFGSSVCVCDVIQVE